MAYTPVPGHVGGFGAIVGRVGRGFPRSVTCGREYTVVATYPYTGPALKVGGDMGELRNLCVRSLTFTVDWHSIFSLPPSLSPATPPPSLCLSVSLLFVCLFVFTRPGCC